ncbi:MAG: helix-turn-helix domain-containing protein [Ruminococcus sp.]|jgi:transcriptional regulator with XRE-family HTH domain|nr:helix-turn-helix domain-containing protein [Ruminococcus sp.]
MDLHEIGRAIKNKRKALHLTQAKTVGDTITRNMLSQVESGVAYPSVKTLIFLSERLGLSVNVSDAETSAYYDYLTAKDNFHAGEFSAVIKTADKYEQGSPLYDEFAALKTRAAIEIAESAYIRRDIKTCAEYAELGRAFAAVGIYANTKTVKHAENLLALCNKETAEAVKEA